MYVCVAGNGEMLVFFLPFFPNNSLIFHVRLGKKRKNVSFYRGVCMCKGKTNTFLSLIFLHLSLIFFQISTHDVKMDIGWCHYESLFIFANNWNKPFWSALSKVQDGFSFLDCSFWTQ